MSSDPSNELFKWYENISGPLSWDPDRLASLDTLQFAVWQLFGRYSAFQKCLYYDQTSSTYKWNPDEQMKSSNQFQLVGLLNRYFTGVYHVQTVTKLFHTFAEMEQNLGEKLFAEFLKEMETTEHAKLLLEAYEDFYPVDVMDLSEKIASMLNDATAIVISDKSFIDSKCLRLTAKELFHPLFQECLSYPNMKSLHMFHVNVLLEYKHKHNSELPNQALIKTYLDTSLEFYKALGQFAETCKHFLEHHAFDKIRKTQKMTQSAFIHFAVTDMSKLASLFVYTEAWSKAHENYTRAVTRYKSPHLYYMMNRLLRGNSIDTSDKRFTGLRVKYEAGKDPTNPTDEEKINVLKQIAQKAVNAVAHGVESPFDIVVYRGIEFEPPLMYVETGLLSTSFNPAVADRFTRGNPYFLQIFVPKGVPGLFLDAISMVGEHEWVMPRGSTLERKGVMHWTYNGTKKALYQYQFKEIQTLPPIA